MRYAGLSSARLASALGVNRSQIVRWRTGDRPVPPHHLPQLREILGGRRTIPGAPPETTWSEQQHLFPLSARASHPVEKMRSASANHSSRPQRQPPRVLATVSLMPIANSATAFLNNWAMRIQPAPTPVSPHRQAGESRARQHSTELRSVRRHRQPRQTDRHPAPLRRAYPYPRLALVPSTHRPTRCLIGDL